MARYSFIPFSYGLVPAIVSVACVAVGCGSSAEQQHLGSAANTEYSVETLAGTGVPGTPTSGLEAIQQPLNEPVSIAVDSQDRVYISDGDRLWLVRTDGLIFYIPLTASFGKILDLSVSHGFTLPPPDPQGTLHVLFVSAEFGMLWFRVFPDHVEFADVYRTDRSGFVAAATDVTVRVGSGGGGQIFIPSTERPIVPDVLVAGRAGATGSDANPCNLNDQGSAPQSCLRTAGRMALDERPMPTPAPSGLDRRFDLYVSDTGNHRIRKITWSGVITTVAGGAGTGLAGDAVRGFSGDGGPAQLARLNTPSGVALDEDGTIFVADAGNLRVRRVDTSGTIATIAGTGRSGSGGDGGTALEASFCGLGGLAVDGSGSIYVADTCNHRVRVLRPRK